MVSVCSLWFYCRDRTLYLEVSRLTGPGLAVSLGQLGAQRPRHRPSKPQPGLQAVHQLVLVLA